MLGCVEQVAPGGGSKSQGDEGSRGDAGTTASCQSGESQSCWLSGGIPGVQICAEDGTWGTCTADTCSGDAVACSLPNGGSGYEACADGGVSSACYPAQCVPGDTRPDSITEDGEQIPCEDWCDLVTLGDGVMEWMWDSRGTCMTPLVLSFEREPVVFTRAPGDFDLAGVEATLPTDWVSAQTPWLAMDLDGNGSIDDGRELFGSMTALPDGTRARNGFLALRALDEDGDGQITPRDPAFSELLVWRDADQDRRSSPAEIVSARDAGIVSIRLDYSVAPRCTDGDCEIERASFVFRDALGSEHEGAVIDVHLAARSPDRL